MFPVDLPVACLPRLIADYSALVKDAWEDLGPLEVLTGIWLEDGCGGMPCESDGAEEVAETDPMKRLQSGEELVLQLHSGLLWEGVTLIDGETYEPTGGDFPQEMAFYGLGLRLKDDRLLVRQILIEGDLNGGTCPSLADFPPSFASRVERYLEGVRG